MRKAKYSVGAAVLFCIFSITQSYLVNEVDAQDVISWDSQEWKSEEEVKFERGRIHYYSMNSGVCNR
jgi:hypothetical protein